MAPHSCFETQPSFFSFPLAQICGKSRFLLLLIHLPDSWFRSTWQVICCLCWCSISLSEVLQIRRVSVLFLWWVGHISSLQFACYSVFDIVTLCFSATLTIFVGSHFCWCIPTASLLLLLGHHPFSTPQFARNMSLELINFVYVCESFDAKKELWWIDLLWHTHRCWFCDLILSKPYHSSSQLNFYLRWIP